MHEIDCFNSFQARRDALLFLLFTLDLAIALLTLPYRHVGRLATFLLHSWILTAFWQTDFDYRKYDVGTVLEIPHLPVLLSLLYNPPILQRYPFPIASNCTTISVLFIPIVHAYHHLSKNWTCSTQATSKSKTKAEEIVNHLSTSTAEASTLDTQATTSGTVR